MRETHGRISSIDDKKKEKVYVAEAAEEGPAEVCVSKRSQD